MEATGLSLLPTALNPELSRGHPLLFHYLGALWMRLWGTSISTAHTYPLFLAIVLLVAFFLFMKSAAKSSVLAVFGTLLLAVQPIFLAQSGLLLPEMQLALFAFVSFVFYVFNRVFLQALFLAAALLTKESALVVALAFLATDFLLLFLKQIDGRDFLKRLIAIAVAVLILGAFLIKQKIDLGWFFFPEHIGLIDTDSALVLKKLERYAAFVFVYSSESVLFKLLKYVSNIELYLFSSSKSLLSTFSGTLRFSLKCVLKAVSVFICESSTNFPCSSRYINLNVLNA